MNAITRVFRRPADDPAPDPRQETINRIIDHQWRAHAILAIISDVERVQSANLHTYGQDRERDIAERDAVAAIMTRYEPVAPLHPDNPHDRVTIAETCLAAIAATLAAPTMTDRPADQCSDITYHIKKDWCDSRREAVPSWYRRPGTGTYYA